MSCALPVVTNVFGAVMLLACISDTVEKKVKQVGNLMTHAVGIAKPLNVVYFTLSFQALVVKYCRQPLEIALASLGLTGPQMSL